MSIVVVYKSQSGFTKRYGEWIAEALGCDVMDAKRVTEKDIDKYDIVVYGGGIIAGQINGLKKMKNWMLKMKDKKYIVYATGGTPAAVTDKIQEILDANITKEEQKTIPFYYFQSGIDYEKLNLLSRLFMKAFSAAMEKKSNKASMEKDMAASIRNSYDITDKKFIEPLVTYIKSL